MSLSIEELKEVLEATDLKPEIVPEAKKKLQEALDGLADFIPPEPWQQEALSLVLTATKVFLATM